MPPSYTVVHIRFQLLAQSNTTSSTWAFQFLAAFFIPTAACIAAIFHTLTCYLSHFARIQFITQFFQIIASLTVTLLAFLQLKYQATNDQSKSPFATQPTAMRVAVASFVVCCLVCLTVLRFPLRRFAFLAHHLLVSAGIIVVASLASVLLPDRAAPVVYAICGLLSAAELLLWLYRKLIAQLWIRRWRFTRFWNNIYPNLGDSSQQVTRMRLQV